MCHLKPQLTDLTTLAPQDMYWIKNPNLKIRHIPALQITASLYIN